MNWNKIKSAPTSQCEVFLNILREKTLCVLLLTISKLQKLRKLLEILCVPVGLLPLSDLTTSPKLITSLLINTKISIDLIRERSGTTQFPRFPDPWSVWPEVGEGPGCQALTRPGTSGCQSETSVLLLSEHYSKLARARKLRFEKWKYIIITGVAQRALTLRWNGRQHVSSVHIRHFTMIQHVQVQLPCLQSRTKTTCKYQNYTFSSITWYVNKPTNVQCWCSLLWVNKRNIVKEKMFYFLYYVGLWNSVENHLSQDKSVTIWRYDISKLSQEFWRNGNVESR